MRKMKSKQNEECMIKENKPEVEENFKITMGSEF